MLMRVGGGANSRLSIARDTRVDIPGHGRDKINAAFAFGGTALAIETVEAYTGVDVNHVIVVSFADFPELIDAMGGITYRGGCVVSRINGGFRTAATRCACRPARRTSTASRRSRSPARATTTATSARTTSRARAASRRSSAR